jgi:hypothetical protein
MNPNQTEQLSLVLAAFANRIVAIPAAVAGPLHTVGILLMAPYLDGLSREPANRRIQGW